MKTIPLFRHTKLKDVYAVAPANTLMWLSPCGDSFKLDPIRIDGGMTTQLYYRHRTWFYYRQDSVKQILKTDKLTTVGEVWLLYLACKTDRSATPIIVGAIGLSEDTLLNDEVLLKSIKETAAVHDKITSTQPNKNICQPISRIVGDEKLDEFVICENALYDFSTLWDFIEPGETWKIEPYYKNTLAVKCSVVKALSEYNEHGYYITKDHAAKTLRITEVENTIVKTFEHRAGLQFGTMLEWINGLRFTGKVEQFHLSEVHKHHAAECSFHDTHDVIAIDITRSVVYKELYSALEKHPLWNIVPEHLTQSGKIEFHPASEILQAGQYYQSEGSYLVAAHWNNGKVDIEYLRHVGERTEGDIVQWLNDCKPAPPLEGKWVQEGTVPTEGLSEVQPHAAVESTESWQLTALDTTKSTLTAVSGSYVLEAYPAGDNTRLIELIVKRNGSVLSSVRLTLEQLDGFDIIVADTTLQIGRITVDLSKGYPELTFI